MAEHGNSSVKLERDEKTRVTGRKTAWWLIDGSRILTP